MVILRVKMTFQLVKNGDLTHEHDDFSGEHSDLTSQELA